MASADTGNVREGNPMGATAKIALVTGAGTGVGKAVAIALGRGRLQSGARRPAPGTARRDRGRGQRRRRAGARRADRRIAARADPGAVRQGENELRPPRRAVQQCRHRRPGGAARGTAVRDLAEGGGHQPDRHVPVHAGSHQDHEGAGPARRPHHQQRLDLGARAAPLFGRLYGDQARGDRADQIRPRSTAGNTTSAAARSTSAMPPRR